MIYYNYIVYLYLGIEIPVVFSETMLHNEFHNWYSEALFPNNVRVSSGSLRWDNIKQQFVVFDYSYVLKPNSRKEDGLLLDRYLKEEPRILSIGLDIIIIPRTDRYDVLFTYINSLYPVITDREGILKFKHQADRDFTFKFNPISDKKVISMIRNQERIFNNKEELI